VAQAFRSKALSGAVSNLLKGGVSKLLTQSNLSVANPSVAASLFSGASRPAANAQSAIGATSQTQVATLGGTGEKGGVGYSKGQKAGVAGQGGGTVSLELADSTVEEGLTKDEVGEVIHKHLSEIRYCYETALLRTPDLEGKLTAAFVIGGSGLVKTANAQASTLPDPRLDDCILRRLKSWRFPKPKGGIDVPVTYPFVFKTLGR
jgi:outer membrane biosynthesis protein TonB